jgi:tetratricopeptide (TPR) repeat protein
VIAVARRHAAAVAVLAVAVAALYGRVLGYDFVKYDDHALIAEHYGDLVKARNLARVFWRDSFAVLGPKSHGIYYRPMLVASYAIDARIAGPRPAWFHATNLALHLLATIFVYALLVTFGTGRRLATGLALIFACHPGSAVAAAWVPGRNESMLAIACIASILALVRFLRGGGAGALAVCVAAYGAALFTKESGAVLLAVLVCAAALERTGRAGEARALAGAGLAAAAATLGWAVLREVALGRSAIPTERALGNLPELIVYLGKMLFPIGLAVVPHPADTSLWPGLLALAVLALATFAARDRLLGPAGLGLVWCAAFLMPSLIAPAQTWGLEHRIYLPLVGLLLFAAQCTPPARLRAPDWSGSALAVAVAIVFAILTARRLPDFAGPIPYWESAARTAPHSVFVASSLPFHYYEAGRYAQVPDAATRALELDGSRAIMYLLRGLAYEKQRDFARAESDLQRAVELDPNSAPGWANLARLQRKLGQEAASRDSQGRARELRQSAQEVIP